MTLTRSGNEIAEYFALASVGDEVCGPTGGPLQPRYNIAPSQEIATIYVEPEVGRQLAWMRWGLVPSWAKDVSIGNRLFNARSETAATKPSFRSAFRRRRCLIAADGFYEWTPRNRGHQPFHFRSSQEHLLALAGLFENWHGEGGEVIESCTVLTTEASQDLEGVHHRMPVLLDPAQRELWLDPNGQPDALQSLLVPAAPGTLTRRAVARRVNDARRDDAACLDAADEATPAAPTATQTTLFEIEGEK